jgi:hypothetical protein
VCLPLHQQQRTLQESERSGMQGSCNEKIFGFLIFKRIMLRFRHVFRNLLYGMQARLSFNGYTRNRTQESISLWVFTIPAYPFSLFSSLARTHANRGKKKFDNYMASW